jgi:HAD superfamily phosphoserine phosphatase-like hydrolase
MLDLTPMKSIAPAELVERLEAEWALAGGAAARGVLAFDGDGTLWTGDVGDDFFEELLERGDVLDGAIRAIQCELADAGVACESDAVAVRVLFDAYHAGVFDEERFYEIVGYAAAGRERSAIEVYVDRVQALRGLHARFQPEVKPVLDWARTRGVDVFVVSASPAIVVERAARHLGIGPAQVLGARAHFDGDTMLASAERPIPYGAGKVTALASRIGDRPLLAAFGDNVFDLPMLQRARIPVVVRPKPRLLARGGDITGFFELVRTL